MGGNEWRPKHSRQRGVKDETIRGEHKGGGKKCAVRPSANRQSRVNGQGRDPTDKSLKHVGCGQGGERTGGLRGKPSKKKKNGPKRVNFKGGIDAQGLKKPTVGGIRTWGKSKGKGRKKNAVVVR